MIFCPRRDFFGLDLLTTRTDLLLQLVEALVRLISDAFLDKRPDSLRGVQLRRVCRDAQLSDPLRHLHSLGAMRGRTVPDEQQPLAFRRVGRGELVEKSLHPCSIKPGQDQPEDTPRLRMCRRIEPEPFVALIDLR